MQDPLNAIRRLYGERGAEDAADAPAEAETFAALKAGLDALPPQRPDAATLAAVFAAAGSAPSSEDVLAPLRAAYGESSGAAASPEALAIAELKDGLDALPAQRPDVATLESIFAAAGSAPSSEDVLAPVRAVYEEEYVSADAPEATAIAELKAGLDALPRRRPDAAALDAVFAAAGSQAPGVARAADRAPKRLVTRRRTVVALSAAFALLLVLTSGLWFGQENDLPTLAAAETEALEERTSGGPAEALADQEAPVPAEEQVAALADASSAAGSREADGGASAPSVSPSTAQAAAPSASPVASGLVTANEPSRPEAVAALAEPRARRSALSDEAQEAEVLTEADLADGVTIPEFDSAEAFAAGNPAASGAAGVVLASDDALPLDDGDEALQTIYLRMQQLQTAQAGLGWDEPPVALGAAPDPTPASQEWMKVRVER